MKLGVGLGRRLYFPPLGLSFSTIISFPSSNTSGTIVSLPPVDCWSSSQSFLPSKGVFQRYGIVTLVWPGGPKVHVGENFVWWAGVVHKAIRSVCGTSPKLVFHEMTYRSSCGIIISSSGCKLPSGLLSCRAVFGSYLRSLMRCRICVLLELSFLTM